MPTGNAPAFPSPSPLKPPTKTQNNFPRIGNNTSTNQACAACKYQRRKCARDCLLAPYFPHDRQRQFLNAHKLFGVCNITKIIKSLDPPEKDAAMHTIIFQSDARANDPVGGCYRIIRELQYQIEHTKAELDITLQHLAMFRDHAHQRSCMQESEGVSSFSRSGVYNNSNPYSYLSVQEQQQYSGGNYNSLQEDMWALQIQDSSTTVNMKNSLTDESEDVKLIEEISSERHDQIEFRPDELVERKLELSSTQLVMLS